MNCVCMWVIFPPFQVYRHWSTIPFSIDTALGFNHTILDLFSDHFNPSSLIRRERNINIHSFMMQMNTVWVYVCVTAFIVNVVWMLSTTELGLFGIFKKRLTPIVQWTTVTNSVTMDKIFEFQHFKWGDLFETFTRKCPYAVRFILFLFSWL